MSLRTAVKRSWRISAETCILHNLWTPPYFRLYERCLLCLKAHIVTTAQRCQIPSIGKMTRMVLDPRAGCRSKGLGAILCSSSRRE